MARNRKLILLLVLCLCLLLVPSEGRKSQKKVSHVSKLVDGTYPQDVKGLAVIVRQFAYVSLEVETGDPCLPSSWFWIECSRDASPRVTALYLQNQNLLGQVPDFSMMDALETIDMHNNFLTGTIPSFLGTLPNLRELNLANNMFSGYVPPSILHNNNLRIDVSQYNSPDLFGGTDETPSTFNYIATKPRKRSKLPAIIGGSASGFVLFWVAVGAFAMVRHRTKTAAAVAEATSGAKNATDTTEETPIRFATAAATPP